MDRPVSRSVNETPVLDPAGRLSFANPQGRMKVVKTLSISEKGDQIQIVRPMPAIDEQSADDIVKDLMKKYDYKKVPVRGDL